MDEEGQVYLVDLPVSGILEVAGWGSTIDPESDESRELEERNPSAYLDQVHSLHGTLRFALEEIRSTRALNLFLEPARRIELHVVDEFNRSVSEVIAARDLLSVKGAAAGEFRQFVLGRNRFATPGVYDLKVAPDIEQEVAILTPRGGAFLKPDALRRAVAHTAHVERTDFITGEVKRRRGLPGLEDVRVVLELDGAPSRSFTTGSGGFFCIHVPRGKRPKTLVVEIDSQNTVTRRRPVRGEFYEIVPDA